MYLYVTFAGPCRVFLRRFQLLLFSCCCLHFTGFFFFLSWKAAMVTLILFSTAPRYLHRIPSVKRSTGRGKPQYRPPLSVFLLTIMIGSRCLQFVISEPPSRKENSTWAISWPTERLSFSTSLDIITRFMVLRLRERRTWGFILFYILVHFFNSLSAWTILILDSHHSLVAW